MAIFRSLRKLFGFTKSGSSLLGERVRGALKKRWIHRGVGVGLVALVTTVVLIKNLSNIGGNTVLAANLTVAKPVIDTITATTIQTPVNFEYESRGFSWFHTGADLADPTGTPVKPIMVGTVKAAIFDSFGYGNHVIVDHSDGVESLYGHLSKIDVTDGQKVDLATVIGEVGSTGFSTGPHLHLEIHQNGQLINPADLVPGVN
jgi:hypothetical protein